MRGARKDSLKLLFVLYKMVKQNFESSNIQIAVASAKEIAMVMGQFGERDRERS